MRNFYYFPLLDSKSNGMENFEKPGMEINNSALSVQIQKRLKLLLGGFIALLFLMIGTAEVYAQPNNPNEAEWNGQGGYSLKKIVSNTSIQSGVNFSYTIMFSAPAGATDIFIQDDVPASLDVVSVAPVSAVNGVTPTVNTSGQTVTYSLTGLPSGSASSGSFTIVVKFPEGVTCDGTTVRNQAGIRINDKFFYTEFVNTTAIAEDPWRISKSIVSGAIVNPNGGSCGYLMGEGDTVTYRLSVLKQSPYYGNVTGQQNMNNAVVTDVLPAGAVFISSSCGATASGSTFTWQPNGGNLDAASPYAYYSCDITVHYPANSFPNGTQITNDATLEGDMCNAPVSHTSGETCIEVANIVPNPDAFFGKYIYMTNRVPGCDGYYRIAFKNNGNVDLSDFNINDVIPSDISVTSINVYGGSQQTTLELYANSGAQHLNINNSPITGSFSTNNFTPPLNDLELQMTGALPVNNWINMYIYFTVDANATPGTVVNNCATFDGLANNLPLDDACVTFTVGEGEPKPCVQKEVCSPENSYEPGDILRFRMRVQNIGSADITGAAIQDVLHSNFTYVGNETYYVVSNYNPSCSGGGSLPSGATAWSGVTPNHSGQNLEWQLPDIASDCQLFYVGYCGYYGTWTLPYHFIEFDVMVDSMAMPGVTENNFEISGGNLTGSKVSNTANVLVVANFGQEVGKQVSTDNGNSFGSTGTGAAGGTARYRLNYKNTSNVPVTSISLVDLLAMNDGANDWLVLDRNTPRGSQFGVTYPTNPNHSTSLSSSGTAPSATVNYASGQNICLPDFGLTAGCTSSSWGGSPDQNVRMDYGSYQLPPGITLREDFNVSIPANAPLQDSVCNDFAAVSTANFLLDGNPQSISLTPIAAPPICLTADSLQTTSCCDNTTLETVQAPELGECCIQFVSDCEVDSFHVNISNGTFSASSWNCGTMPTDYVGQSSYTFDVAQCAVDMKSCITPDSSGIVSAVYTIYYSNGEVCEKNVELDCVAQQSDCCENVKVDIFQDPDLGECCAQFVSECETDSVVVSISNGTFASATLNGTSLSSGFTGQSSFTFDTNSTSAELITCITPDSTGVVVISYVAYFSNGEVCEKRVEMDCEATASDCCENVKVNVFQDPDLDGECCAQFVSKCETDSVVVSISNGTFASATLNGTSLSSGFTGQSSFTFDTNSTSADLVTCVTPDSTGVVVVSYVAYFSNGEVCEKRVEMDCEATTSDCCENVKVDIFQDADLGECCAQFISECETDSVVVSIHNGTFASATLNGTSLSSGFAGQSSFTFDTNSTSANLITCVTPDSTGVVVVSYVAYFSNGEKCERKIEMDCEATEPSSDCCPVIDFKLRRSWPFFNKYVGTFEIINPDPSNPICSIEISASPAGNFNTGTLNIDGTASGQSWTSTSIPATGTLSPQAVNDMLFTLTAFNYKGVVTVCVIKCDGTECCYEFNWNGKPIVVSPWDPVQVGVASKLVAVSVSPEMTEPLDEKIKYVSFGFANEEDLEGNAEFFAIGGTGDCDDEDPGATPEIDPDSDDDGISDGTESYMSRHNAFFELTCPYRPGSGKAPTFNLVLKGGLPKLGMALISEEGNVIFDGEIDLANPDSVISSVEIPGEKSASMFEFINLYPNPTNGSFQVTYAIGNQQDVEIRVMNPLGQTIKVLNPKDNFPGVHNTDIDARDLAGGMYRVFLYSEGEVRSKSVVIDR